MAGRVLFLDSETGEQENGIAAQSSIASCAQLSPDGSRLATDDRLGVRLWPVRIDRSAVKLLGPARVLNSRPAPAKSTLSWDRSGRLLAACDYERGCGIVFDTASGAEIFRTPGHPRTTAAVICPDGRFLATATWQRSDVVVWDVERQSMAWRWSCGSATAQFSPDGRWLVTADISQSANEKAFHFWRVGSWSPGPVIVAFQPIEVTFARDGSRCALSVCRGGSRSSNWAKAPPAFGSGSPGPRALFRKSPRSRSIPRARVWPWATETTHSSCGISRPLSKDWRRWGLSDGTGRTKIPSAALRACTRTKRTASRGASVEQPAYSALRPRPDG